MTFWTMILWNLSEKKRKKLFVRKTFRLQSMTIKSIVWMSTENWSMEANIKRCPSQKDFLRLWELILLHPNISINSTKQWSILDKVKLSSVLSSRKNILMIKAKATPNNLAKRWVKRRMLSIFVPQTTWVKLRMVIFNFLMGKRNKSTIKILPIGNKQIFLTVRSLSMIRRTSKVPKFHQSLQLIRPNIRLSSINLVKTTLQSAPIIASIQVLIRVLQQARPVWVGNKNRQVRQF